MRSVSEARAVRKITGVAARSGSLRIPLQMSSPSESGSMMSNRMRSGRTWRDNSSAPFPVCNPVSEKPSFSRLYFKSAKRSASSSISRIFFMRLCQLNNSDVTEPLRRGEFGIKMLVSKCGFVRGKREKEGRALVEAAFHAGGPVMRGHQMLDDRKAQAGAAQLARARFVHAIEPLEQAR